MSLPEDAAAPVTRTAHCCCGALRAEAEGEPVLVAACHCEQCQRRTGSAFGVSAYYPAESVRTEGPATVFTRPGRHGRQVRGYFCPSCGSTVYWHADFAPGQIGIAAGAFFDPAFPAPTVSAWEQSKHPWVELADAILHLRRQAAR